MLELISVQDPDADASHEVMTELMQQFIESVCNYEIYKTKNILFQLLIVAEKHFKHENHLMENIFYPFYDAHKLAHNIIIERIEQLYDVIGLPYKLIKPLIDVLLVDLHTHIEYYDVPLFSFNNEILRVD